MQESIALVGPTASGKSAMAAALAACRSLEIISMDSAQVYRGLDLGTAKPSAQERASIPHHLIDIRDLTQSYNAAAFAEDASKLIGQIQARENLPLLVGGTMLYLKALMQGLDPMPGADPALRQDIEAQAWRLGWPGMHAELAKVDPLSAERLKTNDAQRIGRALEVYRSSGRTLSSWQLGGAGTATRASPGPIRIVSLEPADRSWLHRRIAERFDAMLAAGLVQEVRDLHERGDLHANLPAMRCVGYRQVWDALEGRLPWSELRELGIAATRQLAKRQLTWLRSMPERRVVICDREDAQAQFISHCGFGPKSATVGGGGAQAAPGIEHIRA